MTNENDHIIRVEIKAILDFLKDSTWFSDEFLTNEQTSSTHPTQRVSRIHQTLAAARSAQEELAVMSRLLNSRVIGRVLEMESRIQYCWHSLTAHPVGV